MIDDHQRLKLKTLGGEEIEVEVNHSNNPNVDKCQVLRFHRGSDVFDLKRDDLISLLLIVGDVGELKELLPMKLTNIKKIERLLTFEWTASRNYEKGERITVKAPWIDEIVSEDEVLSGNISCRKPKFLDRVRKKLITR